MTRPTIPKKVNNNPSTKTHHTKTELISKEILHKIVAEYDKLLEICNSNPTATNKRNLEAYAYHLENPNRLAAYFLDYTVQNEISGASTGDRYLRGIISKALSSGEFVMVDGLIRNTHIVPLDNISATGNTITILIPTSHLESLKRRLDIAIANQSARTYTPCRNLIIVIETGEHTSEINNDLCRTVYKTVTEYVANSPFLKATPPSNSINIVIN